MIEDFNRADVVAAMRRLGSPVMSTWRIRMEMGASSARPVLQLLRGMESDGLVEKVRGYSQSNNICWRLRDFHAKRPWPVCPHCGWRYTVSDMQNTALIGDMDLSVLPPEQAFGTAECPACGAEFWLRGNSVDGYTTATSNEDL